MSYRKSLEIIRELLLVNKREDFLEYEEVQALRVACKSLKKSIYSQEVYDNVYDNDWK